MKIRAGIATLHGENMSFVSRPAGISLFGVPQRRRRVVCQSGTAQMVTRGPVWITDFGTRGFAVTLSLLEESYDTTY